MTKYRITKQGNQLFAYRPQKRVLFFFWKNLTQNLETWDIALRVINMSMEKTISKRAKPFTVWSI